MTQLDRYKQARNVTMIGGLVNALLGFLKLIGGIVFHSHALVADGIHSFSDLFTDVMVLFASKYGSQDADHSHPYGHQRIETAATLLLSMVLILAGAAIGWDALDEIINKTHDMPGYMALPITVFSVIANEALFHYTRFVGMRIKSNLIIANAWHHRSDAASSLVVLVGLIGSLAGFIYLDALAALIVGLMIIKMGWDYGWNSVKELIDTAAPPEQLAVIKNIIEEVDGVLKVHELRSRMMGRDILIDVHILVSPFISVSEGHFIAQHVHHALINKIEHVNDVIVHVDPEDDEVVCPSLNLPNRAWLEQHYFSSWKKIYPSIQSWVLHYLDGKLIIDLLCDNNIDDVDAMTTTLHQDLNNQADIIKVRIMSGQKEMTVDILPSNLM